MPPESLRNSYSNSGVVLFSPGPPPPLGVPDMAPGSLGRDAATTRIPRHSPHAYTRGILIFLALMLVAVAIGYGYRSVKQIQGETATARSEVKLALAKVDAAQDEARLATERLRLSELRVGESEANLAKATKAAADQDKARAAVQSKLQSLLEEGQGQVVLGKDGRLTLQLVDRVLFRSGQAELTQRGQVVMTRVGAALKEMKDKQVWVQGHTDSVPIRADNENFSSNWELSAARALTVVHYLQDQSEINPKRLAAAAFGSHRPVSRRYKSKNRRIEIVLFPREMKLRR